MAAEPEKEIFLRFLRRRGGRITAERLRLFDEIFRQHGHIDAEGLLATMRRREVKISRATVYRNLELMVESGLVRKQRLGQRRYLYEHIHPGQRHDHLVCRECGRVVEFISRGITAMQREIARAHGFDPEDHTLQISGICEACAEIERTASAFDGGARWVERSAASADSSQ